MKRNVTLLLTISIVAFSKIASAQEIIQGDPTQGNGVTQPQIAPTNSLITTSRAQAAAPRSTMTLSSKGSKIEIDSDGSVYSVYPDGARVAAPDGITTLIDGSTIAVRDGKRIP